MTQPHAHIPQTIGFVGLGKVGVPMAINLLRTGSTVLGYSRRPSPEFEAAGGLPAGSMREVAESCAVIVQSLPNVEALAMSVDALVAHARPGTLLIETSSYDLSIKTQQAQRLADAGHCMLDCEVSGLPPQVAVRRAVIFASGDQGQVARAVPVFQGITDLHFNLGPFGAATKMKLVANMLVAVHNLAAAEALHLGARAGLDPAQIMEVLGPSAAGSSTFTNKAPLMVSRQFGAGRGPFSHMFGCLERVARLAAGARAATPLLDCARTLYQAAESQGRHEQDIAAIIELVEAQAAKEPAHA